jgi:DNA-binding NtrC family response regulator
LYEALGGTAYVENLWRLPHRLQARLARLLHDGEAVIADGNERVEFDTQLVVVVDTSTREDGRLESELWQPYLKNRIDLPPLRERREDIPALTAFFVEESCRRANLPVKVLSQPARELLGALPWYGNAGELKILVDGLVARVRSTTITLADVLANVQLEGRVRPFVTLRTLRDARVRFEREYIIQVLEQHHGRVPNAAKALGIQRTNLYRKLRNLKATRTTPVRRRATR